MQQESRAERNTQSRREVGERLAAESGKRTSTGSPNEGGLASYPPNVYIYTHAHTHTYTYTYTRRISVAHGGISPLFTSSALPLSLSYPRALAGKNAKKMLYVRDGRRYIRGNKFRALQEEEGA